MSMIVATDCKAGVKFDLAGHKRRDGSEGHDPSWLDLLWHEDKFLVWIKRGTCSSYVNYSGTHQRSGIKTIN